MLTYDEISGVIQPEKECFESVILRSIFSMVSIFFSFVSEAYIYDDEFKTKEKKTI